MAEEVRELPPSPATISFSNGTTLTGLSGTGRVRQRRPVPGLRSAYPAERDTSPEFERGLRDIGIREQETLDLDATAFGEAPSDQVVLTPARDPRDTAPRVVLYQDESGGLSWHFERAVPVRPELRSGSPVPSIVIPLRTKATQATLSAGTPRATLRGPITKIGRKIFKVLILPIASELLQDPVRWLGEKIESRYRRNLVWHVTPENYKSGPGSDAPFDWSKLTGGPVLLLIHGIFSSVEGMLGGLPRQAMEKWHARYGGRVIAFNHLTVSASPQDNARFFQRQLSNALSDTEITFDILCHSRGGIVSRTLAERPADALGDLECRVRSIYFVATPNAGSPLGDAKHLVDMIDLFTNALTNLPDGPFSYSIEILLGIVTLFAYSGAVALPGIAAFGTHDSYITDVLNPGMSRQRPIYGAAASDFEPQPGRENGWLIDRIGDPLLDRVFTIDGKRTPNDLVVSQQGVFAKNGCELFPIENRLVYEAADGMWHTAFFGNPRTLDHIDRFFDSVWGVEGAPSGPSDNSLEAPPPRKTRGGLRSPAADATIAPLSPVLPKPHVETRDPEIDFYERMVAGDVHDLVVRLRLPGAEPAANALMLEFDAGSEEIKLTVEVNAPGFEILGRRSAPLQIVRPRDEKKEQATFTLRALDPGPEPIVRAIDASFWRGNEIVGGVRHTTAVVPRGNTTLLSGGSDFTSPLRIPAQRRVTCDLIITVRQPDVSKDFFEVTLRSEVSGEEYDAVPCGSFGFDGNLPDYLSQALDPAFASFPGAGVLDSEFDAAVARWNSNFLVRLKDLGAALWLKLPERLRAEYLRLMGLDNPPVSILVQSDEITFPWEIVRPSGSVRGSFYDGPPLGIAHILGRWRPAKRIRPHPQVLQVQRAVGILPDAVANGLPWAADEIAKLKLLMKGFEVVAPVRRREVDDLLNSNDAQLVHFSGHGALGPNADLASLKLENGESIEAMAFASTRLGSEANPVLFLNACSVGRSASALSRAGGFAGNCIEVGWSGVLAPYWKVYDPSASTFSVAFYQKLKAGFPIGEALRELRKEHADDPTAQSYAFFGDPFARLRLP